MFLLFLCCFQKVWLCLMLLENLRIRKIYKVLIFLKQMAREDSGKRLVFLVLIVILVVFLVLIYFGYKPIKNAISGNNNPASIKESNCGKIGTDDGRNFCWAQENKTSYRTPGVFKAGTASSGSLRNYLYSFFLANYPFSQFVFHM